MKVTTLLAAIFAALLPTALLAEGCTHDQKAAMTCADGTIWNPDTKTCVTTTS